jgi:DNA polymerase elongation subunit (family B)
MRSLQISRFRSDNRDASDGARGRAGGSVDCSAFLMDIREYDVPYHVRVAIDKGAVLPIVCCIHVRLLWDLNRR